MTLKKTLMAWMLVAGLAIAGSTAKAQQSPSLPTPSAAALQGGEAPAWNANADNPQFEMGPTAPINSGFQFPGQNAPAPTDNSSAGPATSAPAALNTPPMSPAANEGFAEHAEVNGAPDTAPASAENPAEPRPLVSVLKNKPDVLPIGPDPGAPVSPGIDQPVEQPPIQDPNVAPAQFTFPAQNPPLGSRYPDLSPSAGAAPATRPMTIGTVGAAPGASTEHELPEPSVRTTPPSRSVVSSENTMTADKLAARAASELLTTSLKPMDGARPITLIETLAKVYESNRLPAVRAYWDLSQAASQYHWAVDELKRLEQVVPSRSAVDSPMLSTARAAAAARVNDAKLAYLAAESALLRLIEPQQAFAAADAGKVYPVDQPLVGAYQTHFETIFNNRAVPTNLRQINDALPVRLQVINDRAAAVQAAAGAVHTAEQSHGRGEADMRTVLACHEALHQQRHKFLEAVNQYNAAIVEYAVAVASPSTPTDRFAAMLIHTKQPDRVSALPSSATAQPIGTPRVGTTPNASAGTRTFQNDGWVPSTLRSLDASTIPANRPAPTASTPSASLASPPTTSPAAMAPRAAPANTPPAVRPADPFGSPNVGNRYPGIVSP